ncbi:MAG: bifunctional DNA primase/polymerase [Pseudonocardia sp.]|nr:bifunctional DNA primase/polymerase [Pseudonocardia sp.]
MSWWNSSRAVYGAELRAGALCLVDHGWPVVPGTWWHGGGWRGLPPEMVSGLAKAPGWDSVPAVFGGVAAATCDAARVARWWSRSPFSVLVATGEKLDVVEIPAWLGRRVTSTLRRVGVMAALAATPSGRWWFPVTPGSSIHSDLAGRTDVVLHGLGSWVMAPPSEREDGLVHWRVTPSACGWRLPESQLVQSAAAEAIRWCATESDDWLVSQRPAGVASGVRS